MHRLEWRMVKWRVSVKKNQKWLITFLLIKLQDKDLYFLKGLEKWI